jgi:hypothetical protein
MIELADIVGPDELVVDSSMIVKIGDRIDATMWGETRHLRVAAIEIRPGDEILSRKTLILEPVE